jgi:hypothetical protein
LGLQYLGSYNRKTLIKPNQRRVQGKKRLIMQAKFTDALLDKIKMDAAETALNERNPKIMRTTIQQNKHL